MFAVTVHFLIGVAVYTSSFIVVNVFFFWRYQRPFVKEYIERAEIIMIESDKEDEELADLKRT